MKKSVYVNCVGTEPLIMDRMSQERTIPEGATADQEAASRIFRDRAGDIGIPIRDLVCSLEEAWGMLKPDLGRTEKVRTRITIHERFVRLRHPRGGLDSTV